MNMEDNLSLIYVFDLDGTLCNTEGNWYEKSTPKEDRIALVNKLHDDGHTVIIDTARGCVSGKNWFYYTVNQLNKWGVKFHTLRTGVKFGGDVFVDDKGFNDKVFFDGNSKKTS